ncbi:hypothetical protein ES703_15106 [subsurface metagenome]
MAKGIAMPEIQEEVIWRPKQQLQLFDREQLRNTVPILSPAEPCAPFRKFGLYLMVWGKNAPDTLHFEVQFLERWSGQWYTYKQGLFAALFYEDDDTDPAVYECFCGDVLGRSIRVKVTANDADDADFWEFSAAVDFWN